MYSTTGSKHIIKTSKRDLFKEFNRTNSRATDEDPMNMTNASMI
jgi:hypothetical protein